MGQENFRICIGPWTKAHNQIPTRRPKSFMQNLEMVLMMHTLSWWKIFFIQVANNVSTFHGTVSFPSHKKHFHWITLFTILSGLRRTPSHVVYVALVKCLYISNAIKSHAYYWLTCMPHGTLVYGFMQSTMETWTCKRNFHSWEDRALSMHVISPYPTYNTILEICIHGFQAI
jgi:hypothetical protein